MNFTSISDEDAVLTDGCIMAEIYRWLSPWELKVIRSWNVCASFVTFYILKE